jgi:hypothetical protein
MKISIMSHRSLIVFLAMGLFAAHGAAAQSESKDARPFPHPERIRYDQDCLIIDGKDTFIYSGALHYFRCPKPLWRDRLERIKAAGFNAVESYVPWNIHETQMPDAPTDFSKVNLSDLDDFLSLAEQVGLYVIIRPGPYICAEYNSGGFPRWLFTKRPADYQHSPIWSRSDEPTYLAWAKHWYDAVCPVIAKHQVTRKNPGDRGVILFQVENEYGGSIAPGDSKVNYVKELTKAALANGIDVPIFTCNTFLVAGNQDPILRHVFDSSNFYPGTNVDSIIQPLEYMRKSQPDAPLMTTELQGGTWWKRIYDYHLEEQEGQETPQQINNLTLLTLQQGETILNYYMLYGGTNLDDGAGGSEVGTSYDYTAPIREHGGVGERYQRVRAIGQMLSEHGAKLARSRQVPLDVSVPNKDVSVVLRTAADGARYYFVRTNQISEPRKGQAKVKPVGAQSGELVIDYDLEPFGSSILYFPAGAAQGQWLPKAAPAIHRPVVAAAAVEIPAFVRKADTSTDKWTPVAPGQHREQLGNYNSHFLFYSVAAQAPGKSLRFGTGAGLDTAVDGLVAATLNGQAVHFGQDTNGLIKLPDGNATVLLLDEHGGNGGGEEVLEMLHGADTASIVPSDTGKPVLSPWKLKAMDKSDGEHPEVKADCDDSAWAPAKKQYGAELKGTQTAYRSSLTLADYDARNARVLLNFPYRSIDNAGEIYVNGTQVGTAGGSTKRYSFDITKAVHPGANSVAILVHKDSGCGGLGEVTVQVVDSPSSYTPMQCAIPRGDSEKWFAPEFNDSSWEKVDASPKSASLPNALLTWNRAKFELPAPQKNVRLPWALHLEGTGNGFLYLNGHCLGRIWEKGRQNDYYLPECWLNFGPGQSNQLTIALRTTDSGAVITAAKIIPLSQFAEERQSR